MGECEHGILSSIVVTVKSTLGNHGLMKRHRIEYSKHWTPGPMTNWVHVPSPTDPAKLMPPAPEPLPDKGMTRRASLQKQETAYNTLM
jgi:hypothetical protein